jgi:hydroxylysine kinase
MFSGMLGAAAPEVSDDEMAGLAKRHFGISGAVKRLTSERDLNLRIGDFVVKLANAAEPAEVTDFQTKALIYLEGSDLPVPRLLRSVTGAEVVELAEGRLRVLSYLHGLPQHLTPQSRAQSANLARMAARLSLGLAGFSHPAEAHVLQWDIKQAAALRGMLAAVPAPLQAVAQAAMQRFEDLEPQLAALRWQVVHGDLNPHNVLVNMSDPTQISGILDFGDMVRTPLICDAAIACSYAIDPEKPMESMVNFAQAYHGVLPLTAEERRLFADLVATRMLTTLVVAHARAARYPENAPYILRNVPSAAAGIMALAALPRDAVLAAMEVL